MRVRDRVLGALEKNRGATLKGTKLAEDLSVSRNAIWKAIEALRAEGHEIESTAGGYRLSEGSDRLSPASIAQFLPDDFCRLQVMQSVDSTNLRAKALAAEGAPEGTVVLSERQAAGRGRLGRSFYSPEGTGAYFSIVTRPRATAQQAASLTTIAAVAVAQAIESVAGRACAIKWVNDVLIDGKKVCGILTEASLDLESGGVEYAVVGIGLNVQRPLEAVPPELDGIIGYIYDAPPSGQARSQLVARVLERFQHYYAALHEKTWLDAYRAHSATLGHTIDVIQPGGTRRAQALSIDENFALVVKYEDGTVQALSSGEVSTRL